ncbi:uncharacterized protein K02A2.6-like [Sabethes cyaneus]|uniref:uncharacterized protein K02A2.6-like n=1 Tax=Sabethes cyaneus TaxID=53552 RepID=UPI00237D853C|nr:uncharacterized protein K02A2.6-like [Sabethes cyaneus]
MRTRLLSKIEERGDVTLEQLSIECQRLMNLHHDTALIEGSSNAVNVISRRQPNFHKFRKQSVAKKDNSPKQHSSSMEKKPSGPLSYPQSVNAKAASGDSLKLVSQFECPISVNGVTHVGTIFVAEKDLHIFGLDLIEAFHLDSVPMNAFCYEVSVFPTSVNRLKAHYPQVFSTELGKCTTTTVKLKLKPDQIPVFRPKRPVAYAMYSAVDDELHRLESMNIITPVDYSERAAPIYPLPLTQEIFVKLTHCEVFSIVGMSESYLQLQVDEATSKLPAINAHRGIFKVYRLAPEVKAAPGAFQQVVDAMLVDLQHTSGYIDDIIVGRRNEEKHWENLKALFERLLGHNQANTSSCRRVRRSCFSRGR